jgi:hypothetical protein
VRTVQLPQLCAKVCITFKAAKVQSDLVLRAATGHLSSVMQRRLPQTQKVVSGGRAKATKRICKYDILQKRNTMQPRVNGVASHALLIRWVIACEYSLQSTECCLDRNVKHTCNQSRKVSHLQLRCGTPCLHMFRVLIFGLDCDYPRYVSVVIIDREGALRKIVLSHLVRGVRQLRSGPTPPL